MGMYKLALYINVCHIKSKFKIFCRKILSRGVATGGNGARTSTFLQDEFCNSFKTEQKLGRGVTS